MLILDSLPIEPPKPILPSPLLPHTPCAGVHTHTDKHAHNTHARARTHSQARAHTRAHAHTHPHRHARSHVFTLTLTHLQTHTHTRTHTHTLTHSQTRTLTPPQTLGELTERLKGWRVMLETVIEDTYPAVMRMEVEAPTVGGGG